VCIGTEKSEDMAESNDDKTAERHERAAAKEAMNAALA